MEASLNFTIGLSHGIQWPWPIAVYLFLAGISGGAMAIALLVNLFKGNYENTPLLKSASMVAFVTIALGMVCLVADLTKPLAFWRILINYNLTSVMSLGVIALIAYIPLTFILMLMAFGPKCCPALSGLIAAFDGVRKPLYWIVLILALTICAYTGFLISALVRFPLMNTAVLPGLFVASGLSAGAAAARLFAVVCFGEKHEGCDAPRRISDHGRRTFLHLHDRDGDGARQRGSAACGCGLHDRNVGHAFLVRRDRCGLCPALDRELRKIGRCLLSGRSGEHLRHDVPACVHPLRRSDIRALEHRVRTVFAVHSEASGVRRKRG